MNTKRVGTLLLIILALSVTLPVLSIITPEVKAQESGTFPVDTFNGMQISYSVQGITLNAPDDSGGFVPSREYSGTVNAGTTVTISGTFHMSWKASVTGHVSVSAGNAEDAKEYDLTTNDSTPTMDKPFSATITVPSNAYALSFAISMDAFYGNGESRGVEILGDIEVTGRTSAVSYITLKSNAYSDYIYTESTPFTLTATVYGEDYTLVPDGTVVTFSLSDRFGSLAGANIYPTSAGTYSSEVTVTFTPPNDYYWDDPNHDPTATNRITVTASAGGKQASYIIYIEPDETSPDYTYPPTDPPDNGGDNSPCIIATATYGGPLAAEVVFMRSVRDDMIGASTTGQVLVTAWNAFYYSWSPPVASAIRGSEPLQTTFEIALFPLLSSMHLVAVTYASLAWINADFAAVVAFTIAAVLSIGIYVLPLVGLVIYLVVRVRARRMQTFSRKH